MHEARTSQFPLLNKFFKKRRINRGLEVVKGHGLNYYGNHLPSRRVNGNTKEQLFLYKYRERKASALHCGLLVG
jgi:hypothetical protein